MSIISPNSSSVGGAASSDDQIIYIAEDVMITTVGGVNAFDFSVYENVQFIVEGYVASSEPNNASIDGASDIYGASS